MTIACLKQLVESGQIARDEETVAYITGAGLKTVEAIEQGLSEPIRITPRVDEFDAAFEARSAVPAAAGV